MSKNNENHSHSCPCESGKTYMTCCQPYVEQVIDAPTAEALMRSRYAAFVLQNKDYLRYSWHPDKCPSDIMINVQTKWLGLKIKSKAAGEMDDVNGQVEFIARSKNNGKANRLHENSRFTRYNGRWVYLDDAPAA